MDIQNFFSWDVAATVPGAALMVYVLFTVLKDIIHLIYLGPKLQLIEKCLIYVLSLAIVLIMVTLSNTPEWADYVLGILNAAVVALAVDKLISGQVKIEARKQQELLERKARK